MLSLSSPLFNSVCVSGKEGKDCRSVEGPARDSAFMIDGFAGLVEHICCYLCPHVTWRKVFSRANLASAKKVHPPPTFALIAKPLISRKTGLESSCPSLQRWRPPKLIQSLVWAGGKALPLLVSGKTYFWRLCAYEGPSLSTPAGGGEGHKESLRGKGGIAGNCAFVHHARRETSKMDAPSQTALLKIH